MMTKYIFYILLLLTSVVSRAQIDENNKEKFDLAFFDAINERIKGNYDKSNKYLEQCLSINDTDDAVYFKIAQNYYELKNYEQALFYLKKAKNINPDNKWYQQLFIEIKIEQGVDKKEITRLINAYKPIAKNKYIIGNLYRKLYNSKVKISYTKPTPKKNNESDENLWKKLWKEKNYGEIISKAEKTLMENPADVQAYLYAAKAEFALNKTRKALDYLDMGIDFVQQNKNLRKQYYQLYIELYQQLKLDKKADKYRQKLQKL